jgi:hypothetical protein
MEVTENILVDKYQNDTRLLHLAKTPLMDKLHKTSLINSRQLYIRGFNLAGRPEGLWLAYGSSWLKKTTQLDNPAFPPCCYFYEVKLKPDAKLITIGNDEDFEKFDQNTPNYWVNMDYFNLDTIDYITHKPITSHKKYNFDINKINRAGGQTLRDSLIKNNIIFADKDAAIKHCEFYKTSGIKVDRFKYKDWALIAQDYDGIVFDHRSEHGTASMKYLWFQSLDVTSTCVWNNSCIEKINLLCHKIDASTWKLNDGEIDKS